MARLKSINSAFIFLQDFKGNKKKKTIFSNALILPRQIKLISNLVHSVFFFFLLKNTTFSFFKDLNFDKVVFVNFAAILLTSTHKKTTKNVIFSFRKNPQNVNLSKIQLLKF